MSDYSKLPPIAVSLGGFAFNGEHIEYWKAQATKADREITSLRASEADLFAKLAEATADLDDALKRLASARKAAIEECAKFVEQHQETSSGSERYLSARKVGNQMALAYVDGIRNLAHTDDHQNEPVESAPPSFDGTTYGDACLTSADDPALKTDQGQP